MARIDLRSTTVTRTLLSALLLGIASLPGAVSGLAQTHPTARWYYEPQYEPPERQADMQHMLLELRFVPEQGLVLGTVTHRFAALREKVDSLFFNGPGIRITSALYNGRPARFTATDDGVTVHLSPPARPGTTDSITFVYQAHPRRGLYFIGWNDRTGTSRKQIWSQGQGIDNRHWFPCYDAQNDKLITETVITFDARYRVLSNGSMVGMRRNPDGTATWHYRMSHPHSVYLVMLGIGSYAVDERRSTSGVPLHLWYYPEQPDRVIPTYLYSAEAVDFMEEETGVAYPWESYAQIPVQDFLYGAMENTTATVFGDALFVDARAFLDRNYIGVNVHELAHQWFGDYVTSRAPRHSWLHESFATFYPKLFLRRTEGEDAYQWARKKEHDAALEASEQNRLPILHSRAGRARVYDKGSAVIDMMRYTFGETEVRRVLTHFLQKHAYGLVESNDLYQAFQDVLGISPWWFFEQWIYRGGEPHYAVSCEDLAVGGSRRTRFTVRQTHLRDDLVGLFRMPIVFAVHYADGSADSTRVMIERETEIVDVPNRRNAPIAFTLFDPGNWILKKVSFPKPFPELRAQAVRAPQMIDRYDAVEAMRNVAAGTKRDALREIYRKESFAEIRAEAVRQLVSDPHASAREAVRLAVRDRAPEVRRALLSSLTAIEPGDRQLFEQLLGDSSYEVAALALKTLSAQFPEETERYLRLTAQDRGVGNAIRVLRHELAAGSGDAASRDSLALLARPENEFRTRINAFEALSRLNLLDEGIVRSLFDAMTHPNGRLRGSATDVARKFLTQTAHKTLMRAVLASGGWQEWQRAILKEVVDIP